MEEKLNYNTFRDEIEILEGLNIAMLFTDFRADMQTTNDRRPHNNETTQDVKKNLVQDAAFDANDPAEVWNNSKHYLYGSDNLFPQNIDKIVKKNSKLQVGLGAAARDLLGFGIETGQYDYSEDEKRFKSVRFREFNRFYDRANVFRNYLIPTARNLKKYYVSFVSVIVSKDGSKIAALKSISPTKCRLSKDGKFCYISTWWDKGVIDNTDKTKVQTVPVIDSFFDTAAELREKVSKSSTKEFMYVVRFPTEQDVYPLPDWVSIIEQGWVDVSNDVPNFKRWLLKNLTTINQIMYVNEAYFEEKYPDWKQLKSQCKTDTKDADGKGSTAFAILTARRKELVTQIQAKLKGSDKAGSMITVPMLKEYVGNQTVDSKAITIETVPGTDFTGKYNADANEADAQILFALGIDPAQYGNLTRTDSQGGTGKREGHNIAQASQYVFEQLLLEPLYFKRDFDQTTGEEDLEFRIKRSVTPTLDKITPSQRELNNEQ
jgi:hypothetical protein